LEDWQNVGESRRTKRGKARKIKSLVGELKLKAKQVQRLGLEPRSRLSPLLQKCCLRLGANESYQNAEQEIEALTGMKVGHTSHQKLVNPLVCLGDGYDGVWNVVREFGADELSRLEILDWFHLVENLYKVGGSLKRIKAAKDLLGKGLVAEAKALFTNCTGKKFRNFIAYLDKHRARIVNYEYYQSEQICSIGSGAVESGNIENTHVPTIDR
jgi:hypothetical protein